MGGRRVPVTRPRARTVDGQEVLLQSHAHFGADDVLLQQVVLQRMLAGVVRQLIPRVPGAGVQVVQILTDDFGARGHWPIIGGPPV